MQSLFLDPAKKGNLAQTSVCYTLALCIGLIVSAVCSGGIAAMMQPNAITIILALTPVALFLYWAVVGAVRVVKILKTIPSLNTSSHEFNAIQALSVSLFVVSALYYGGDFLQDFTEWALMVQIFLAVFYIFLMVFTVMAGCKISIKCVVGFILALTSITLSIIKVLRWILI